MKLYNKSDEKREGKESFVSHLPEEPYRTPWRRDYARLIHSPSFRRLQGKTQLFPGVESDFFRNRLTHSIEVSQIAKSIAIRINHNYQITGELKQKKGGKPFGIDTDLIEFAGLAHDLGHPPFGHQGEEALDQCMIKYGGFEGNAQTIRILARLEKKFETKGYGFSEGKDGRIGLNLCMRTLASVLKYDSVIPQTESGREELAKKHTGKNITPVKGYYDCDSELIENIKKSVVGKSTYDKGKFKTIECYIMDIADDIAYSTYDLEDGFKAGFISPLDLLYPSNKLIDAVTEKVNKNLKKEGIKKILRKEDILDLVKEHLFNFGESPQTVDYNIEDKGKYFIDFVGSNVDHQYRTSQLICKDGSIRTGITSSLVGRFVRGTHLEFNKECPALSKVFLDEDTRILVEILKTFTFMSQITSPRLKIAEYRGKEIVTKIFNTLNSDSGYELMPEDVQEVYREAKADYKKRVICDFIASMTDKYAIEFYGRLTSENPKTIFKPF